MNFNPHLDLKDKHAFLSPSNYYWLNYSPEKLEQVYFTRKAAELGTRLHAFAKEAIELGVKQARTQSTLNMYINDAIAYHMTPEVILKYSENCFGTADAICVRKNRLRIHDLKTGFVPAKMEQLLIYAALYCLEYRDQPNAFHEIELRIYQNDQIVVHNPSPEEIKFIMEKIIDFDKRIQNFKTGG